MNSERNLEELLVEVGEFGRFQFNLQLIFFFMRVPQQMQVLITYFTSLSPTWVCIDHNSTCATNFTYSADDTSRCMLARNSWEYSTHSSYSIVTEFDLACGKEWVANLSTTITFFGWTMGSIILGWVADKYGRKNILLLSYSFMLTVPLLGAFSPTVEVFIVSRFITGFFMGGVLVTLLVMAAEFVGPSYRPITCFIVIIASTVGNALLCFCAYFTQNWQILSIICTCPYYIALAFWKYLPESIKWLQSKGFHFRMNQLLARIAQTNKKGKQYVNVKLLEDDPIITEKNVFALFNSRSMLLRSLSQGYGWFAAILGFYGLSLASSDFGIASLYVNFTLAILVEIPGSLIAVYACRRYGRKPSTIYPLLGSGFCCVLVALLSESGWTGWIRLFFGLVGKLSITVTFDAIHTWSLELHPTHLRAIGIGYVQVTGRLGGAAAPWIARWLGVYSKRAPFIVMAVVMLSSALPLFILPETKDTFEITEKSPILCNSEVVL